MQRQPTDQDTSVVTVPLSAVNPSPVVTDDAALERAVEYVLDECFFTVGQVVGGRKTLAYDAVVFWRDHYRAKFLGAMKRFGNRWQHDRHNVTSVALMLGERALRHASHLSAINAEAARLASLDVERYCTIHARHAARVHRSDASDNATTLIAGYWCI